MQRRLALLVSFFFLVVASGVFLGATEATDKKPPEEVTFKAKNGDVTFPHAEHVKREANKCATCHDSLFPQSREPINFKKGMHKPAAAKKESCAACHVAKGKAFETKGNCNRCHVK
ncbi:MAG: c(7)-type cytochrome triheme domain-containing protein [Candidatus Paceibacterota bacterium]